MRFIASPIYRAFPELDAFDDARCSDYLERACGGSFARAMLGAAAGVCAAGTVFALSLAAVLSMPFLKHAFRSWDENVVLGVLGALMLFAFGLGLLVWRDLLLRLLVLRVLKATPRCQSCDYSTMGLLVSGAFAATCPECGHGIDLAAHRKHCVPGIDGALRFMPPPGLLADRRRFWTLQRRRAVARTVRRITGAVAIFAGTVVLPVAALVLAESWSARSDQAALPTPEVLDAALLPPGVQPSGESIALQLGAIALWQPDQLRDAWLRTRDRFARTFRWGGTPTGSAQAASPAKTASEDLDSLHPTQIAMVADCIAQGRAASMRLPEIQTGFGKDWIYTRAVPMLWQLSNVALAAAVERRDGAAFARALEWQLAAMRILASLPPFVIGNEHEAAIVRVTAEALRADADGTLAPALEAAIGRQSVRPSMEAMKAAIVDWEVNWLAEWFMSPRGVVWPTWSDPPVKRWAEACGVRWLGLYWPQRRAIREHAGTLFEEMMADPSDRNQARALAAMVALADSGPIAGGRLLGLNSYHSTSSELRGALLERALVTVVAIERFRRAEGRLPDSLAELCPRFADAVPKDPFAKGPFVYRVLPADPATAWHPGYALWSVGANGSDEGGNPDSDVVFVPPPPWPEPPADPSAPSAPAATRGN